MTVTATINSGALNEVGFPGSQQGESLIELVGTVAVVATISAITVLSTTGATAAPSANGIAGQPNIKAYLTAAVAPSAEASCGAITRIRTIPDALVVSGSVSTPSADLKRRLSATGSPTASHSASANIKTFRGATASCAATPASTGSTRRIQFSAYLNSGAFTTLESQRRIPYSATTVATATWLVDEVMGRAVSAIGSASGYGTTTERISKAHFLGAATAPTVTSTASTRRNATTSAIVTAQAVSVGQGRQNANTTPQPLTVSAVTSADSLLHVLRGATIDQSMIAVAVGVGIESRDSAIETCQAIGACEAVVKNYVNCLPEVASAVVSSPQTLTLTQYAGSASGQAVAAPIELQMRALRGASAEGIATASASPTQVFSLSAAATPSAIAPDVNAEVENYVFPVLEPATAIAQVLGIELKVPVSASGIAQAAAVSGLGMLLGASASTIAQATAAAAGADYAVTAPAPIERRMTVANQNRRMEVLT